MTDIDCPTEELLSQYILGTLSENAVPEVVDHLEVCSTCSDTITRLESQTDSFTGMLRIRQTIQDSELLQEGPFLNAVASLSQIVIEDSVAGSGNWQDGEISSALSSGHFPRPGQRLGQYVLLDLVGKGGMGLVFRARHQKLNKIVALKVLSAARVHQPRMQERFHREMQAAGKIEHPNVVRASYSDESDGVPFLVMEFIDGTDLSALLKHRGPLSIQHACELIRMAAIGLQQIHQAGMVHRDLKPGNLMLSRNGDVKILDLGLALLNPQHSTSVDQLTSTGQLMGTIDYMAPEQADDTHTVDFRADIYGLGATLFALLTGRGPVGGRQLTLMKKLSLLANESAPSVQSLRADVPDRLAEIVARMLDRDPGRRFSSAEDVATALTPFCSSEGLAGLLKDDAFNSQSLPEWSGTDSLLDTVIQLAEIPVQSQTIEAADVSMPPLTSLRRLWKVTLPTAFFVMLAGLVWLIGSGRYGSSRTVDSSVGTASRNPPAEAVGVPGSPAELLNAAVTPASTEALKAIAAGAAENLAESDTASRWQVFSSAAPPDLRTDAIHRGRAIIPAEMLLDRLLREEEPSVRGGLLLAISEFSQDEMVEAAQSLSRKATAAESLTLTDTLLHWYVKDPDPEVHGCVEYLLRLWGQQPMLQQLRPLLEQKLMPFDSGWYQPLHVSSMVVISGPRTARLGSPVTEPGRSTTPLQNEELRTVTIPHTFAISSTEVTRYQYWRVEKDYWKTTPPDEPQAPINAVQWQQAAEFCNRLSHLEGIPSDEHCYAATQVANRVEWRQKENALELTGYRLPTDEEWEIACRAGTGSMRPNGQDETWFRKYVVGEQPDGSRMDVGCRKPNPFGLFDMLGNVAEWIHTDPIRKDSEKGIRRVRGGSAWTQASGLRSAARYFFGSGTKSPKVGFRVARTIVRRPYEESSPDSLDSRIEIQVGPPACFPELASFADQEFQTLRDEQVVGLGNWNVPNVMTRRFRIKNMTDEAIQLSEPPRMNQHFEFDPAPPLRIESRAAVEFGIRMPIAVGVGERSHDVHFRWGDMQQFEHPPFRIHGCIEGPLLAVMGVGHAGQAPSPVNMGTVPVGAVSGITLFAINIGDRPMEAEVAEVTGPFALASPLKGVLVPHHIDESFRIVLNSIVPGSFDGKVTLRTNQQPPVEYTFPIRAGVSDSRLMSSVGVFRNGTWLIDFNRDAQPDEVFQFGASGDKPLTGDWNGDGICDVAVWRTTQDEKVLLQFRLRGENPEPPLEQSQLTLDHIACTPIVADRDGDGRTDVGCVIPQTTGDELLWCFDTAHDGTFQDRIVFGQPGDDLVVGDWNGDGMDDIAVSRKNAHAPGDPRFWQLHRSGAIPTRDREFVYLFTRDTPIAGDWDGDGDDNPGGWSGPPDSSPSFWQFDTDSDGHSNCDLVNLGVAMDIPVVLRNKAHQRPRP